MDFDESKNESHSQNVTKNRKTLILLFVMFITPVILAYAAYFGNWFTGPGGAQGELINNELVTDIEDYDFIKADNTAITGKEFETLYWWVVPLTDEGCNQDCTNLNLNTVNQTYIGLGKESTRINQLVVLESNSSIDTDVFPKAVSQFSQSGVKAKLKTHSGKQLDLPANYIYLVDPLGNIFMRYPLVKDEQSAPEVSRKLRKDILHLFKYSRLG